MNGATDLDACKTRRTYGRGQSLCRCSPKCAVCGYGPHVALHGPALGQLPGSKPWDHEYTMPNDVPSEALRDGIDAQEQVRVLRTALEKCVNFIETWKNTLAGNQMSEEDFDATAGVEEAYKTLAAQEPSKEAHA